MPSSTPRQPQPAAPGEMEQFTAAVWDWFLNTAHAEVLGRYGDDYSKTVHLRECGVDLATSGVPEFGFYDSWGGTFGGYEQVRGMVAEHAACRCGQVTDAKVVKDETLPLADIIRGVIAARPTDT